MAKKATTPKAAPAAKIAPAVVDSTIVKTTPARNSPIPRAEPLGISPKKEITSDAIAKRAFEIACGGTGGDELSNWLRAERELKGL